MRFRSDSIVLRRIPYGDSDLIVTLYDRALGRFTAIAKGARSSKKRFAGAIEPGSLIGAICSEHKVGAFARIEEARAVRPMNGIMRSLLRLNGQARAIDLALSFLPEREASPHKFDLLSDHLMQLSERDPRSIDIVNYELKWLSFCGYQLRIERCGLCERELHPAHSFSFDFENGGLVCGGCVPSRWKINLGADEMTGFMALNSSVDGSVADQKVAMAGRIVGQYVDHLLGRPTRSSAFLDYGDL